MNTKERYWKAGLFCSAFFYVAASFFVLVASAFPRHWGVSSGAGEIVKAAWRSAVFYLPSAIGVGIDPGYFVRHNFFPLSLALYCLVYFLLMFFLSHFPGSGAGRLRWSLLLTLVAAVPFFFLPYLQSSDVFDYIFRGRLVVLYHANPLWTQPAMYSNDLYYGKIFWTNGFGVYGPVWMLWAAALVAIAERLHSTVFGTLIVFKVFALALHLINGYFVWSLLKKRGQVNPSLGASLYLLNPLALIEFAGNAHNDALMILLVLWAFRLKTDRRGILPIALLCLASLTKIFCLPLVFFAIVDLLRFAPGTKERVSLALQVGGVGAALAGVFYFPFWRGFETLSLAFSGPANTFLLTSLWVPITAFVTLPRVPLLTLFWRGSEPHQYATLLNIVCCLFLGWRIGARGLSVEKASAWYALLLTTVGMPWFMPWYAVFPLAMGLVSMSDSLKGASVLFSALSIFLYAFISRGFFAPGAPPVFLPLALIFGLPLIYAATKNKD